MKTGTFSLKIMLTGLCFAIFVVAGCSKASTDTSMIPDPGYGCTTNQIVQTITNLPGKLVYSTYENKWLLSLDLCNNVGICYIICHICNYDTNIEVVTNGHNTSEVISVTVSGKIRNATYNQAPMSSHAGYRDDYLITINTIQN